MEMKMIKIQGFEGIVQKTIYPKKINLFLGENGTGKSSTLRALRYALTGEHQEDFIHMNSTSCFVEIEFVNGITISRETAPNAKGAFVTKCKMNGKTTTAKSITEYLSQNGCDHTSLKLITAGDIANALPDNEGLAEYILSQLNMQLSFESIEAHAGQLSSEAVELMRKYFGKGGFDIDEITKVHDEIKAERTILNRKLKEHQAKSIFRGTMPGRTDTQIQKDLDEILKKEASKDALKEANTSYQQALAARNKILDEIDTQQNAYDAMDAKRPNPKLKEDATMQIEALKEQATNLSRMETTLLENIKMYKKTLENLSSTHCPLSEKLICKTDKTKIRKELEDLNQRNRDELNLIYDSISSNKEKIKEEEQKLEAYKKAEEEYQKKVNVLSKINLLKSNLPQVPTKPTELSGESEDFSSKKEILKRERKNLMEFEEAKKEQSIADNLQREIKNYTDAISFLSPKEKGGIKEKILLSALSVFLTRCQDRARELNFPFTLQLYCKKGLEFYCEDANGNSIPVRKASEGEQIHLMFLILDMINRLAGTKYLVIDNFNHMDQKNFESLLKLLQKKEVLNEYEHIFIAQLPHQEVKDYISKNSTSINVISM